MYNGTDGTTMGSFLTKEDTLYVFNGDACRSLNAKYKELSNVKGIPAWRFILPASMFASPTKNPANKCFCQTPDDPDMCDGIFDLGPCQMGAPLAFSFPHFMHAGPKITANVEGMNPDVEKHESFFDVEPTIGAPMRAAGRLQVNVLMKPNRLLAGFGGVREAVVPFVWIEESAEVAGQFEWMLKGAIFPMLAIDYGSFFAMLGGMGLLGYTGVYAFNRRKILNPPKQEKPPVVTADPYQMDTQTKNMYPNPYTVSGRIVENGKGTGNESAWTGADPPVYSISQQQYNQSQNSGTQTSPINANTNPKLQRVTWSPPGSAEAYPME
ncbi:unnamed protein product [Medioppia subpectinata]|uniref:Scavenger receptor class B member 1 n=1 Tax=Medioppia subpectinata TaxID=1979941 RepID=A0A7R9L8K1_9ACAR|nr:unnamed protein product [Medioppia subpectinata]CAG2116860.1 unnamed protein product [Medioppia subpectinata]